MDDLNLAQWGELLLRLVHVLAGIAWVGMLYWFNMVWLRWVPVIPKESMKLILPQALGRGVAVAKTGVMVSVLFGLLMYVRVYWWTGEGFGPSGYLLDADGSLTDRSWWIHTGIVAALVMAVFMLVIAGPAYKVLIGAVAAGGPPPPAAMKRARLGGMVNTMLSGPVVVSMIGAGHYSSLNFLFLVALVAAVIITMLAIQASAKIKPY